MDRIAFEKILNIILEDESFWTIVLKSGERFFERSVSPETPYSDAIIIDSYIHYDNIECGFIEIEVIKETIKPKHSGKTILKRKHYIPISEISYIYSEKIVLNH